MKVRLLVAILASVGVLAACASTDSQDKGIANPQAPNTCADLVAQCARNVDCCSLWCVNGVCTQKEP